MINTKTELKYDSLAPAPLANWEQWLSPGLHFPLSGQLLQVWKWNTKNRSNKCKLYYLSVNGMKNVDLNNIEIRSVRPAAYIIAGTPNFCSMKWLGVFSFPCLIKNYSIVGLHCLTAFNSLAAIHTPVSGEKHWESKVSCPMIKGSTRLTLKHRPLYLESRVVIIRLPCLPQYM